MAYYSCPEKFFPLYQAIAKQPVIASALQRSNLPLNGRILSKNFHRLTGDCFTRWGMLVRNDMDGKELILMTL
jgi:hypothetical protein